MAKAEGFNLERRTFTDRHGKRQRAARYAVRFRDHVGVWRRLPAYTDKGASATFGRRLRELADRRAAGERPDADLARWLDDQPPAVIDKLSAWGIIDARTTTARRPLDGLLAEWQAAILTAGRTVEHVELSVQRVRRIVEGVGAARFVDLDAERVAGFLDEVRVSRRKDGKNARPLGAQSRKHHIRAAKAFAAWMVRTGRASSSPVANLDAPHVEPERERRAMSGDELRHLLDMTHQTGEPWRGTTGPERAALYALAATTGLRANELRSLAVSAFDLDGDAPAVTVEAKAAKNRKRAVLPLAPEVAAMLRDRFRGKLPGARAFVVPARTADMLKRDLEAARAAWIKDGRTVDERAERAESGFLAREDDRGHVLDFHALRVTFISQLARGGVHPRIAQALARHCDIRLTMDAYTKIGADDERAALAALPGLDLAHMCPDRIGAGA